MTCPSGKRCYESKSRAKRALKAVTAEARTGFTKKIPKLHLTQCRKCLYWHLTSKE